VNNLILEAGHYNFIVQNILSDIPYLKLSDEVDLVINEVGHFKIQIFDFLGGTLSTQDPNPISVGEVNFIGSFQKQFPNTITTDKLDWTKCDSDKNCGNPPWSNIESTYCVCDCKNCSNSCVPCSNDGDCSLCRYCSCSSSQPCPCNNTLNMATKFLSQT